MKVSVIVIAKNAEKTLATCLSSVFEQTHKPDEVIVVDGRSEDGTREVASDFPVKLMVAPPKDTYGLSRNIGVRASLGDVVMFLDSDDYAERNWLQVLGETIAASDVGMVGAKRNYVYPHNWFTEFKWDLLGGRRGRARETTTQVDKTRIGKVIPISSPGPHLGTSGSAYKKEAIEKAGYFDEDMFFGCEDADLALRIMNLKYKILFVPNAVIHFTPARSVGEWFDETFYRVGLGYGTLRRRYGHYKPPLITPFVTFCVASGIVVGLIWEFPILPLLSVLGLISLIAWKTLSYAAKTGKIIDSLAYTLLEISVRHLAFFGFVLGFLLSPKSLRRIAGR